MSSTNEYYPRVHFADSLNDPDSGTGTASATAPACATGNRSVSPQPQEFPPRCDISTGYESSGGYSRGGYTNMYLCPQETFKMTRSSPSSPAGSNVSIVGSLVGPRATTSGQPSMSWKLRARYSKRRGQERSSDRERQPSVCSDSETDSLNGSHVMGKCSVFSFWFLIYSFIEDINFGTPTAKKWSLPLPIVTRSSESDSASSSWSARSADEGTEDERSPVPSPSASTHSDDIDNLLAVGHSSGHKAPGFSEKNLKAVELQTRKLAIRAKETEEFVYQEKAESSQLVAEGGAETKQPKDKCK